MINLQDYIQEINSLKVQRTELTCEITTLKDKLKAYRIVDERNKEEIADLKDKLHRRNKIIENLRRENKELKDRLAEYQNILTQRANRIEELEIYFFNKKGLYKDFEDNR